MLLLTFPEQFTRSSQRNNCVVCRNRRIAEGMVQFPLFLFDYGVFSFKHKPLVVFRQGLQRPDGREGLPIPELPVMLQAFSELMSGGRKALEMMPLMGTMIGEMLIFRPC